MFCWRKNVCESSQEPEGQAAALQRRMPSGAEQGVVWKTNPSPR